MDFVVLADMSTTEKKWKEGLIPNIARESEKLWNMKVTFIPIVIGTLSTITELLIKGLEDSEIRGLLNYCDRSEYWEESWRVEEFCCDSNSSERPSANADIKKKLSMSNNNNNNNDRK